MCQTCIFGATSLLIAASPEQCRMLGKTSFLDIVALQAFSGTGAVRLTDPHLEVGMFPVAKALDRFSIGRMNHTLDQISTAGLA